MRDAGTRAHGRAGSKELTISNTFQLGRIYEASAGPTVTGWAEDAPSVRFHTLL